jgi:AraC-like DNA-binding protein
LSRELRCRIFKKSTIELNRRKDDEIRLGNLHLDKPRIEELDRRIRELFRERNPFLHINYTLTRMAKDTHIPVHHLSAFVNHYYGMNFSDFINRERILYCLSRIAGMDWKNMKIETIAKMFGFSNRNTFRKAFKRNTGMTPSKYLKNKIGSDDR